jgi:hypothetical protein
MGIHIYFWYPGENKLSFEKDLRRHHSLISKLMKNRQHNDQTKKDKRTKKDLQNITQKSTD